MGVCRQINAATIFFSQKRLKNFGPRKVHTPKEQQDKIFKRNFSSETSSVGLLQ